MVVITPSNNGAIIWSGSSTKRRACDRNRQVVRWREHADEES